MGSVVAQCSDIMPKEREDDFCLAEIDLQRLQSVRQGIVVPKYRQIPST